MSITARSRANCEYRRQVRLMGNSFEFTVVDKDPVNAERNLEAAIAETMRIERLITTFQDGSETSRINAAAGKQPVVVSREVFELIHRANSISELTDGAFDLSYGSVDKSLWNFDRSMRRLPAPELAAKMVKLVNFRNILLDYKSSSVMLLNEGMRIGFGGIGKGYAADRAKSVLRAAGVESGIVNASGDLVTWGSQANGDPWTVGIAHPDAANQPMASLNISDMAIATSGDYEKFVIIGGKRYSHTINPRTGLPVSGIKSVTIIAPSAELADALATPVNVMGVAAGLELINQLTGLHAIVVTTNNQIHTSKKINLV